MKRLFGTDGIRGIAGEFPLDKATVRTIGNSLSNYFREELSRDPRFVTGRDTRESGGWIEAEIHSGIHEGGGEVESAGIITTPGVAYVTNAFRFDAGIVISASHNPFEDNGIKIFSPSGKKISSDIERQIEADIYAAQGSAIPVGSRKADSASANQFRAAYLDHLAEKVGGLDLSHRKIVLDCANGAASDLAPELFKRLGANVTAINCSPDGRNINLNCGSLHLDGLQRRVIEEKADAGIAFDGDADRALFVNEKGEVVDGDATLWVMARYLKDHGKLANSTVVSTVMSNIGLELALKGEGIELNRAQVGDKYVLDELLANGSEIGGEQSGHIIFPEISLVGDGMMTALLLLRAIVERGVSVSEATTGFSRYPQVLVNVKVKEKRPFAEIPAIAEAARELETRLAGSGRLLLRYSGTENLARVMIEGKDQAQIESQALGLASVIEASLG
ncbi:MAG: phosphoglucosamine mutase [Acidobacteria bacterium]|nr:phosphoglucosamine mutase [Acidobacteriota bacterium]